MPDAARDVLPCLLPDELHEQRVVTGVTSNLKDRVKKHREKAYPAAFTSRYNVWKLVYFEEFGEMRAAIEREKQIKGGPRRRKVELIERANPGWRDLYWELKD
jgi:putative endonuclease